MQIKGPQVGLSEEEIYEHAVSVREARWLIFTLLSLDQTERN